MTVQFNKDKLENFMKQYLVSVMMNNKDFDFGEDGDYDINLRRIKKIDNVGVRFSVTLSQDGCIYISITHSKTNVYLYKSLIKEVEFNDELKVKNMLSALVECDKIIVRLIMTLKFNKTLYELTTLEFDDEIYNMLGIDINECSICYDKISYKTPCGHDVCFDCYDKIDGISKKCPICRGIIQYFTFTEHINSIN
jgi:hypothetical protein